MNSLNYRARITEMSPSQVVALAFWLLPPLKLGEAERWRGK